MSRGNEKAIRIMLGEGNPEVRRGLSNALRLRGYHGVVETSDYEDIIDAVDKNEIDVIICDSSLGGFNLSEFFHKIRHHEIGNNPFLILIVLASNLTTSMIHKFIESGADDVIAKPLSPGILIERIKVLTMKRKGFVVTTGYIGPNRRDFERPDTQDVPLIDVPNSLKYYAEGNTDMDALQKAVDNCINEVNEHKKERHAFQIDYLVNEIIPHYIDGVASEDVIPILDQLEYVTSDLIRRMNGSDMVHIRELCESLYKLVVSINKSPLTPSPKDVRLLSELGVAVMKSFSAGEDEMKGAADISASVSERVV